MSTETLKISLVQRILNTGNTNVLQKINELLDKENIIGYDLKGNPITDKDFIKELDQINAEIDNGTAALYSHDQVKKRFTDANKLVQ